MKAELRADGLHIDGYVNVPGRQSRPVMTPHGMVIEVIEQRAFGRAIDRATEVKMLLDHDEKRKLASTKDKSLTVREDAVGLRAESVVTDPEVIEAAQNGRIRGWSFNMKNVKDDVEQRAEGLPIRTVHDFDMDEITLVVNKVPVYSSTSVEIRSGEEELAEYRADESEFSFVDNSPHEPGPDPKPTPKPKYHEKYMGRIESLRR